jgi:membrane fusion protein (multidrug efflux system)
MTIRTRFSNPNGRIRHGSAAKVVLTSPISQSILIPQKATFEMQDRLFAFVVGEDRKASMRRITTRGRIGEDFVVESGVSVNDTLVTEGVQYISEGDPISVEIAPAVSTAKQNEEVTAG